MSLTSYRAAPPRVTLVALVIWSGRGYLFGLEDLAATDFPTP